MPIPEHTTPDTPLELARSTLVHLQQLTSVATTRSDRHMLPPQVEAAMRSQQDGLMAMAQAAAQVSIAESLAEIAQLLRPEIRIEVKSQGGSGEVDAASVVQRLRALVNQYWPADRVPLEELLPILGEPPGAVARGH